MLDSSPYFRCLSTRVIQFGVLVMGFGSGDAVEAQLPTIRLSVRENRWFLHRAVEFAAQQAGSAEILGHADAGRADLVGVRASGRPDHGTFRQDAAAAGHSAPARRTGAGRLSRRDRGEGGVPPKARPINVGVKALQRRGEGAVRAARRARRLGRGGRERGAAAGPQHRHGTWRDALPVVALVVLLACPVLAVVATKRVADRRGVGLDAATVALVLITGLVTAVVVIAARRAGG
jgi:hypothetical protein